VDVAASRREWERRWAAADVQEKRSLLRMALRGHPLKVQPALPGDRGNIAARVTIDDTMKPGAS
jgi:hypothetical protein